MEFQYFALLAENLFEECRLLRSGAYFSFKNVIFHAIKGRSLRIALNLTRLLVA
jgi:hypothetical protein